MGRTGTYRKIREREEAAGEMARTAEQHKEGDLRCGRPWQCTCAACIQAREGVSKAEWLRSVK